jgi:cell division protein FtsN
MPRSDDPNGFPPNRGGRGSPPTTRPTPRHDNARDWRYPDPSERYATHYDDHDERALHRAEPPYDPEPAPPRSARVPYAEDDYRGPAQPPEDDPFGWDDPVASAPRDDSLFRRISGTLDDGYDDFGLDRARLGRDGLDHDPRRADPRDAHDDYFDPDFGAEDYTDTPQPSPPQDMHDRFFSRDVAEDEPPIARDSASASIYDFDAHRPGARPVDDGYDDADPWDDYDDAGAPPVALAQRGHRQNAHDLDADFFDDDDEDIEPAAPARKKGRIALVAGVLIGAIAVGGGAAYLYKSLEGGDLSSLEPPTLFADSTPAKGDPSEPGGREFPHGNKQIYDRLSGQPPQPERETRPAPVTAGVPGIVTTGSDTLPDTLEERIEAALRQASRSSETGSPSTDTDSPRAVRTLVVRPDGSVEAPPVAASAAAPATTTTAGIVTTTSGPGTRAQERSASEPQTQADARPAESRTPQPAARPQPPAQTAETAAPSAAQQERRVASLEPEQAAAPRTATAGANPFFVQIAARRGQTDALAAFADLQQRYPSILSGLTPTIKRADLGDKGVWYRLWVGPLSSKSSADGVCDQLKSAGLKGCFVRTE